MKRLDVRCAIISSPLETITDFKQDIILGHGEYYDKFRDLLKKIFVYDPARRLTAKEALQHPWFKMVCSPDDGTEAVKIRQEQIRQQQNLQREQEERIPREAKRPKYAESGGSTHDYYPGTYQHRAELGTDLAPIRIS
jgi:serine/threonine protein kinase